MKVSIAPEVKQLRLAIVEGFGLDVKPSRVEWRDYARPLVEQVKTNGPAGGQPRRDAVRQLLRFGGFKPSGRSKPAQEYLLRTVETAGLPEIVNAVDVINIHSLTSGLPISLLARERLSEEVLVRYGRDGEAFVFNQSGQQIDIGGLLCICSGLDPEQPALGTPVKDSLRGKITPEDRNVVAFIYAPQAEVSAEELTEIAERLAADWRQWCAAETCHCSQPHSLT